MECAICYKECTPNRTKKLILCGHEFCNECSKEWFFKAEDPSCPLCRRPFIFRGLLSSQQSWLNEKAEKQENDDSEFHQMFDYIVETVGKINSGYTMYLLSNLQDTYNVLTRWWGVHPEDAHEMLKYGEIDYTSWFGNFGKYKYLDEPPKQKHIKKVSRYQYKRMKWRV